MVALTLGSCVVTLLPTPTQGIDRESARRAADAAPRFLRLLDAWSWCGSLWRSSVVAAYVEEERCGESLGAAYEQIEQTSTLASLRRVTRHASQIRRAEVSLANKDNDAAFGFLDLLCADLLKGGGDPGISVPVVATLDRFGVEHRMVCVRGDADSLTQRIESRLATKVFSFGMPVLLRASGTVIGRLRHDLRSELAELRSCVAEAFEAKAASAHALRVTAECYAAAFGDWAGSVVGHDDDLGERVTAGFVSVTGVILPVDAAMRSAQVATSAAPIHSQRIAGVHLVGRSSEGHRGRPENGAMAKAVRALVIRESRIRPAAG